MSRTIFVTFLSAVVLFSMIMLTQTAPAENQESEEHNKREAFFGHGNDHHDDGHEYGGHGYSGHEYGGHGYSGHEYGGHGHRDDHEGGADYRDRGLWHSLFGRKVNV
ncbi:hypothetical protein CHUAL_003178 [Chamberlinius hualienensis]